MRVNLSVAVISMKTQYGWTKPQEGLVLGSFFYGYICTQVPLAPAAGLLAPVPVLARRAGARGPAPRRHTQHPHTPHACARPLAADPPRRCDRARTTWQVAGGYLATRFGGKWVFGIGVLCTSLLTIATPFVAGNFTLLIACRVLEGIGE